MALIGVLEERYASHEIERAVIESAGHRMLDIEPDKGEWADWLAEVDGLLVNLTPIGREELERLPRLKAISRYGVGVDAIDLSEASAHGVAVLNQPAIMVAEVSDHTIALWLACMRQIVPRDAAVRRGEWNIRTPAPTRRLQGGVFGMIGFGRVGRAVAVRLKVFSPERILVYDPYVDDQEILDAGCVPVAFDQLIAESGTISLHAPLTDETRDMINGETIARMKRGACLLNTSRGGLVDEDAVVHALEDGQLHSVGFDVFPEEPPASSRLLRHPGAVFTDHCAWYSVQSQVDLQRAAAEAIVAYLDGNRDMSIVNA
ncbi:MAG: C-terminal binding protein [Spirochaetia bacterium]